tara:strand:+ start:5760 stop:5978 length:219 start_codon:yes stop_codon:yes gene_type:complete
MTKKRVSKTSKVKEKCSSTCHSSGCGYFLGFIGAVIYYISTADSFWMGVLGFLKALVWPAVLVFELLKLVGA